MGAFVLAGRAALHTAQALGSLRSPETDIRDATHHRLAARDLGVRRLVAV
jgi:hypothetical protein